MAGPIRIAILAQSAQAVREMGKTTAAAEGMGRKVSAVGRGLTHAVTLPVLAVGAASIKMASDFQDSMEKLHGLVGISKKQVDDWSNDILSLSGKVAQSPKALADAMFFITSAGLRGKTALDALKQSAKAASSGLGDTATIADAVTSAMNAYGAGNVSASRATDILTAAVKEGKLAAASLAPVIGKTLPIASAMGVSFAEVAGAMALMSRSGTNAATSATQVTSIISTFSKPSKAMITALTAMHTNLDAVRTSLADKGLVPTITNLRDEAKKAGIDLSAVFGNKRALSGVLQLTGNLKATKSVMKGVKDSTGAADKAFKSASKTTNFQFKKAVATLQGELIRLGTKGLPVVTHALTDVTDALDWFDKRPDIFKKVALSTVAGLAVLGPVLSLGGRLATLGKAVNGVGRTASRAASAEFVQKVFVTNPGFGVAGGGGVVAEAEGITAAAAAAGAAAATAAIPRLFGAGIALQIGHLALQAFNSVSRARVTPSGADAASLRASRIGAASGLRIIGGGATSDIDFDRLSTSLLRYGSSSRYAARLVAELNAATHKGVSQDDFNKITGALSDLNTVIHTSGNGFKSTTARVDALKTKLQTASRSMDLVGHSSSRVFPNAAKVVENVTAKLEGINGVKATEAFDLVGHSASRNSVLAGRQVDILTGKLKNLPDRVIKIGADTSQALADIRVMREQVDALHGKTIIIRTTGGHVAGDPSPAPTPKQQPRVVNLNVTTTFPTDPYEVGEKLRGYLNEFDSVG